MFHKNRTWILPCCLMFLKDQLHTLEMYITCTTTVLCCTGSFNFCAYNLCIQRSSLWRGLPQVLLIFFYLSVVSLSVCPFLYWIRKTFSMKLLLFPILCLRNIYHGFWFFPDNVRQIKSANFLTLRSWIVVESIFIEFKYRQWKATTHMPTIVDVVQPKMPPLISFYGTQRKQFPIFWNRTSLWCRAHMYILNYFPLLYIVSEIGLSTIT